jgi:K(+)-stimulated pyrophosphate-energized sodium pump
MNPVIKFTTLFGLLAVELAVGMNRTTSMTLASGFLFLSVVFVWRSFYGMRIDSAGAEAAADKKAA